MGRSTIATIVPFVIKGTEINDIIKRMSPDQYDDEIEGKENGWTFHFDIAESYAGKNKKTLYCDLLTKDNLKIFVVNESEWASGGANDYCVFSTDNNALLEFCNDFNVKSKIISNDVVQQTL